MGRRAWGQGRSIGEARDGQKQASVTRVHSDKEDGDVRRKTTEETRNTPRAGRRLAGFSEGAEVGFSSRRRLPAECTDRFRSAQRRTPCSLLTVLVVFVVSERAWRARHSSSIFHGFLVRPGSSSDRANGFGVSEHTIFKFDCSRFS